MNGFLATLKWQGCMGKILTQQHSAEEEEWAFLLFPRFFTSIMHVCKRTGGQNFRLKIPVIPKNVKLFLILKLTVEYFL